MNQNIAAFTFPIFNVMSAGSVKWTDIDVIVSKSFLCQKASETLIKKMEVNDSIFPWDEFKVSREMHALFWRHADFALGKTCLFSVMIEWKDFLQNHP